MARIEGGVGGANSPPASAHITGLKAALKTAINDYLTANPSTTAVEVGHALEQTQAGSWKNRSNGGAIP